MKSPVRRWRRLTIPLVAALVVAVAGWWTGRVLERAIQADVRDELETLLDADVTALRLWIEQQRSVAESTAERPDVRRLAAELRAPGTTAPWKRSAGAGLRQLLEPVAEEFGYTGWGLISPDLRVLAAGRDEVLGVSVAGGREWLEKALAGETRITQPLPGESVFEAGAGGEATLFSAAPVPGPQGEPIAVLGFRIPSEQFTRILSVARMGLSGETYAFDADGVLVSYSRFDDQLREIGLLPNDPSVPSILNVEIRNPGGNMAEGFVPQVPLRARPLTRMAADAVSGRPGVDVDGYADYRGVPVVGAWTWLPELEIGVATEVDVAEAYALLFTLRTAFGTLVGLLVLGAIGFFVYTAMIDRLHNKVRRAERLGQYRLVRKIGQGGMGKVYLAEHAMLRRPTAVKMIRSEENDEAQFMRFEREVQFTSQLTHPNTIRVFDYGRTPEGVFYYAMEYLEGITLSRAVEVGGPLPEERVVHILLQIAGSLAEAHAAGLVHRDIKPANIILCVRGGLYDFVKVLDFGLVRRVDQSQTKALTQAQMITGTPAYMSPEAITTPEKVDFRSDIYSLGGVGYFLLTGGSMFQGDAFEVCNQHVHSEVEPPSKRLGRPVSPQIEAILMRCLEKDAARRMPDAATLISALEGCPEAHAWTQARAREWWETKLDWSQVEKAADSGPRTPLSTDRSAFGVDPHGRGRTGTQRTIGR